ncbi:BQ5605_C001g00167 [Microbotryum silenes-dioicae]|uniref:BQ5605_C001g00167 protein n=1 Tax=Microbotryum silenes-dioicae TaxID=796604 RepID=A0A2X0M6U4_9BASI|nr:BQ5605_C001g00167 [Microbotryum silenes-dioicae]
MPRKASVPGAAAATSNPTTTTTDDAAANASSADTLGLAQFELPKALALSHDAAHEKNQKTISATHVLEAIKELGWDDQQALNKYLAVHLRAFRKNVEDKKNGVVRPTTSKPSSAAAGPIAVPVGAGSEEPARKTRTTRKTVAAAQQAENEVEAAAALQVVEPNGVGSLGEDEEAAEQDPYQTEDEDEDQIDLGPDDEEDEVVDDEEELDEDADDGPGLEDDPMQDED